MTGTSVTSIDVLQARGAAIAASPDVILATSQGVEAVGGVDGLLRMPGLAQTPAARQRRSLASDAPTGGLDRAPRLALVAAVLRARDHAWVETVGLSALAIGLILLRVADVKQRPELKKPAGRAAA